MGRVLLFLPAFAAVVKSWKPPGLVGEFKPSSAPLLTDRERGEERGVGVYINANVCTGTHTKQNSKYYCRCTERT